MESVCLIDEESGNCVHCIVTAVDENGFCEAVGPQGQLYEYCGVDRQECYEIWMEQGTDKILLRA